MPETCLCKPGWQGPNCTECVPYWNCQHGYCEQPWECICKPGYHGAQCNETESVGKTKCWAKPFEPFGLFWVKLNSLFMNFTYNFNTIMKMKFLNLFGRW